MTPATGSPATLVSSNVCHLVGVDDDDSLTSRYRITGALVDIAEVSDDQGEIAALCARR